MGDYVDAQGRGRNLSWQQLARMGGPPEDPPKCGHSACRQNYIDTGEGECIVTREEGDGPPEWCGRCGTWDLECGCGDHCVEVE